MPYFMHVCTNNTDKIFQFRPFSIINTLFLLCLLYISHLCTHSSTVSWLLWDQELSFIRKELGCRRSPNCSLVLHYYHWMAECLGLVGLNTTATPSDQHCPEGAAQEHNRSLELDSRKNCNDTYIKSFLASAFPVNDGGGVEVEVGRYLRNGIVASIIGIVMLTVAVVWGRRYAWRSGAATGRMRRPRCSPWRVGRVGSVWCVRGVGHLENCYYVKIKQQQCTVLVKVLAMGAGVNLAFFTKSW